MRKEGLIGIEEEGSISPSLNRLALTCVPDLDQYSFTSSGAFTFLAGSQLLCVAECYNTMPAIRKLTISFPLTTSSSHSVRYSQLQATSMTSRISCDLASHDQLARSTCYTGVTCMIPSSHAHGPAPCGPITLSLIFHASLSCSAIHPFLIPFYSIP